MSSPREALLKVVREVLAPLISADQGELYLVSVTDSSVQLHLGGRYAGCPGNTLTRRRIIEPVVQNAVPHAEVVVTSGALVPAGAERIVSQD
ncbi:MAG TPA: NifU family protein [Polyangiaceae bacterium]|nr:NifU family protein [Polyangiaceae bacterium]